MWHCFSCGAGGNLLNFVSLMEGVDIRQAGLLIQKWFGIVSREDKKLAKEKEEVQKHLDGTIHIFYKGEELPYKLIVPQEDERYAPSQMEALAVGV